MLVVAGALIRLVGDESMSNYYRHYIILSLYVRSVNYTVFQKSDAKIEITIATSNFIKIKHPLSNFNYHLSSANVANFNRIHCIVTVISILASLFGTQCIYRQITS